jgi:hypothetical protein
MKFRRTAVDASGKMSPVPGSEFIHPCDQILLAIGQLKQHDRLKKLFPGLAIDAKGRVEVDPLTGATSLAKVFSGGDCANGGKEVVNAVGEGKKSALAIHKMLVGEEVEGPMSKPRATASAACPSAPESSSPSACRNADPISNHPKTMADLSINFGGINSPNPFWIASGPPSNTAYQSHRAFEAGWGGVVWKTIGDPIVNVASRYSAMHLGGQRMVGFNNIELISDRSIETNFREIKPKSKTAGPESRRDRLPHGRYPRALARIRQALRRLRSRWIRTQFRLPPRHVRTRHGVGCWTKPRRRRNHRRLGHGSRHQSPSSSNSPRTSPTSSTPPAPPNAPEPTPSR